MMLLLYLLGMTGLTLVITISRVAKPLRKMFLPPIGSKGLNDNENHTAVLLHCPMCCGTWVGLLFGTTYVFRSSLPLIISLPIDCLMFAFATSIISYFIFALLNHVEAP